MTAARDAGARSLSLDQWLTHALGDDGPSEAGQAVTTPSSHCFPSTRLLLEYRRTIAARPEGEVVQLIERLLLPSCALGIDHRRSEGATLAGLDGHPAAQYRRRLAQWRSGASTALPWEGLTWLIDLLPFSPRLAVEIIDAYLLVHGGELPDERAQGLDDARELILARFIEAPTLAEGAGGLGTLRGLRPRELECVVAQLYARMGYGVELTPATRDGGRDLIARRSRLGAAEHLLVEIKQVGQVGVEIPRALLGVVISERANKGVVVTTGSFSAPARAFLAANAMEGIAGVELVELLNAHCGRGWDRRVPAMIDGALARWTRL